MTDRLICVGALFAWFALGGLLAVLILAAIIVLGIVAIWFPPIGLLLLFVVTIGSVIFQAVIELASLFFRIGRAFGNRIADRMGITS